MATAASLIAADLIQTAGFGAEAAFMVLDTFMTHIPLSGVGLVDPQHKRKTQRVTNLYAKTFLTH